MSDENPHEAGSTAVTIYGRTYQLRGDVDAAYLTRLASIVDGKMREVAQSTGTADTMKVAILAALNIAADAMQGRGDSRPRLDRDDEERLHRVTTLLERAIADPSLSGRGSGVDAIPESRTETRD